MSLSDGVAWEKEFKTCKNVNSIDLSKVLKGHEGKKFYSNVLHYDVTLLSVKPYKFEDVTVVKIQADDWDLPIDICITPESFWPSKEQSDWNIWIKK